MRKKLVVANWKMYGSLQRCHEFVPLLKEAFTPQVEMVLCPPAPYLGVVAALLDGSSLAIGAQDVSDLSEGAFTGEWSAGMLGNLGCSFAIIGHSERRSRHSESDALVAAKAHACISAGVTPIVCIGETEDERASGKTEEVLARQLNALLTQEVGSKLVLAYEPIWAIGTGQAASPETAQKSHAYIRSMLHTWNPFIAERVPILYGGSMKAKNAAALFKMEDIDGGLVGSASLDPHEFISIYSHAMIN